MHRHGTERLDLHEALGQAKSFAGDPDGARRGELLHAGGQVGGLANGRVVHAEIGADRTDHDLSGVQPHANPDRDPVSAKRLFGVALHRLLHAQSRVAGPNGVVLVGDGRPEQRHDPVAHHLVHGPLVAMNGLHHALEDRVEELARLLGIAIGQQLHRPLEICEEHGDLLALAFQGGLGGEDLLGQVPGGVRLRGGRTNRGRGPGGHGLAALEAEAGAPGQFRTTGAARKREASSTPEAEPRVGRVVLLAPGTRHGGGGSDWGHPLHSATTPAGSGSFSFPAVATFPR